MLTGCILENARRRPSPHAVPHLAILRSCCLPSNRRRGALAAKNKAIDDRAEGSVADDQIRRSVSSTPRLTSEEIASGATEYKCAPPIRDPRNREGLWNGLDKGVIDFVVSDHSPSPPDMKCLDTGDFFKAWGGIASLQLGLPVLWTKMSRQNFSLEHLARWMCSGPAQMVGLEKQKGAIAQGCDADLVVWNPQKSFTVEREMIQHRHKLTPYLKQSLRGIVQATFLKGEMIYDRGRFLGSPRGALLLRGKR
jgi:allantoinase